MSRKIITFDMIKKLRDFSDGKNLFTSFYLSTVPERGDFVERALEMLRKARKEPGNYSEEERNFIEEDLKSIEDFVKNTLVHQVKDPDPYIVKGVAIFSSKQGGIFQVYHLPNPLRERIVIDYSPFIRPLTLLLDEYKRYLVVVVDYKKARFYEMFMGAIVDTGKIVDVNQKARLISPPARLKRKYDYKKAEHFLKVGEVLDILMQAKEIDLVIIGSPDRIKDELYLYLPFRIRQRIAGSFHADPDEKLDSILEKARKVEEEFEREEEKMIVEELKDRLKTGQLAVSGLKDTLDALMHNQVQTLIVESGYEVSGVRCPVCGFLGTDEEICPVCGTKTLKVQDIIDDAIEEAIEQGASVEHVINKDLIRPLGHIGALLRFEGS